MEPLKPFIFGGRSHSDLTKKIAEYLKFPHGERDIHNFSNGEIYIQIQENIRGRHTFIIQSFTQNINNEIIELLLMIDVMKRASTKKNNRCFTDISLRTQRPKSKITRTNFCKNNGEYAR